MALIKCSECRKEISDKATACIGCGAPVPNAEAPQAASTEQAAPAAKKEDPKSIGCAIIIMAAIAGAILFSCSGGKKSDKSAEPKQLDKIAALTHCQSVLKNLTRDPEKADVPYVTGKEYSDAFSFEWSTGSKLIRARNGLGLEVGIPGECTVSKETRKITRIGIDGKVIDLSKKPQ